MGRRLQTECDLQSAKPGRRVAQAAVPCHAMTSLLGGSPGGTRPEAFGAGTFTGSELGDVALIEGLCDEGHGFTTLGQVDGGWVVTLHMLDGSVAATCLITGKTLDCGIEGTIQALRDPALKCHVESTWTEHEM